MSLKKEVLEQLLEKTIRIKGELDEWFSGKLPMKYHYSITNRAITNRYWLVQSWYISSSSIQYKKCNKSSYYYEIQELNDIIEYLLTHISYQPGGLGMLESNIHFENST